MGCEEKVKDKNCPFEKLPDYHGGSFI